MNGFERRVVTRLFVGLCVIAGTARAQAPLPVPDLPIGLAGTVYALARQPDGGMIVGGQFTMVDGASRSNLARLRPDGSLDPDWNPSLDGAVHAVVVDAAGRVYVGGDFNEVAGVPRNHLARMIATGSLDQRWNPGHELEFGDDGTYGLSLALGTQGELFASGSMRSDRLGLSGAIKISNDATGTIDPVWNPHLGGRVVADARGFLYIAGGFDAHAVQKISQSGRGEIVADWHPPWDAAPSAMAIGPDGSLYLGWSFYYSQERHLGRIPTDGDGAFDALWSPVCESDPTAFAFDGDATYVSFSGGSGTAHIVRLSGRTGTHVDWQAPGSDNVRALVVGADRSIYVGGKFPTPWDPEQSAGLRPKLSLARLDAMDGRILPSPDAAMPGTVSAIARQSDGHFIVGGQFDIAGTAPRTNILRMAADGSVDPDWAPTLALLNVGAIALDGDVYVSGQTPGPVFQNHINSSIVKLAGSGAGIVDEDWHVSVWGEIDVLAMDERGGMYVGGAFSKLDDPLGMDGNRNLWKVSLRDARIDAIAYPAFAPVRAILVNADDDAVYLASGYDGPISFIGDDIGNAVTRLSNSTGSMQHGWSRSLSSGPRALVRSPDGSVYAAGSFSAVAADPFNDVLKFSRDGIPDAQWNTAAEVDRGDYRSARALAIDDVGDIYIGGYRGVPWGEYFLPLAYAEKRSGTSGAALAGWSPSFDGLLVIDEFVGTSATNAISVAADGTILVGGNFTMAGGEPRSGFAAFSPGASADAVRGHSSHARPGPFPASPAPSPGRMRPVPTQALDAVSTH